MYAHITISVGMLQAWLTAIRRAEMFCKDKHFSFVYQSVYEAYKSL